MSELKAAIEHLRRLEAGEDRLSVYPNYTEDVRNYIIEKDFQLVARAYLALTEDATT